MKKSVILMLICFLCIGIIWGKEFWEKGYKEWKYDEVEKMLSDSPWSGTVTYTDQRQGRNTRNVGGEMELYNQYTVRFFTALPVRQGYVRMFQIMNKYDELSKDEQKAFDQKFAPALRDFDKEVMINMDFASNDPNARMEVDRRLKQITADQLKQSAFLITDSHGRVEITQYHPPSPDGTGAKFVFPRKVDGKEVIQESDKEVKFELWVPGTGHKVFHVWKVKDMKYDGKLVY
jgi:hypothetical protein